MSPSRPLLSAVVLLPLVFPAAVRPTAAQEHSGKRIYERVIQSAALVLDGNRKARGSGWLLDAERKLLVTNHHVVAGLTAVEVVFPYTADGKLVAERAYYDRHIGELVAQGRATRGFVLDSDPRRDLAVVVLKSVPAGALALPLAPESASPGEAVHSVGNPGASNSLWVYSAGTVRQVSRQVVRYNSGQVVVGRVMETSSPINPGDSGSPVVNDRGELVGVNSGVKNRARLLTFSIDVTEVRQYVAEVRGMMRPRSARDFAKLGDFHFSRRRWAMAERAYRQAVGAEPTNARYHADLGLTLSWLNRPEEAAAAVRVAIDREDKIVARWWAFGPEGGWLGRATGPERLLAPSRGGTGGVGRAFAGGEIFRYTEGKHAGKVVVLSGTFARRYRESPTLFDEMGYPVADESDSTPSPAGTRGHRQFFENGVLIRHADGPRRGRVYAVYGQIGRLYSSMGGAGSRLGMPVSDEYEFEGRRRSDFEGGSITWTAKEGARARLN